MAAIKMKKTIITDRDLAEGATALGAIQETIRGLIRVVVESQLPMDTQRQIVERETERMKSLDRVKAFLEKQRKVLP